MFVLFEPFKMICLLLVVVVVPVDFYFTSRCKDTEKGFNHDYNNQFTIIKSIVSDFKPFCILGL